MPIYNDANNNIFQTNGSDIVWSTTRKPALLLVNDAITVDPFVISYPDLAKSNAYGFAVDNQSTCMSMITVNPQEWDSGRTLLATVPSGTNYFEAQVTLTRTKTPDDFQADSFPDSWGSGSTHIVDGGALLETSGPIARIFTFERSGNSIYLRRKQSVTDGGDRWNWNSGNNNDTQSGGMRNGWTYGGDRRGWFASVRDIRTGGSIQKRRGGSNQCTLTDNTDYSSTWTGRLIITPGYIEL